MPGFSPATQQGLYDWELCRAALSCHFALDIFLQVHGVVSRGAIAMSPSTVIRNVKLAERQRERGTCHGQARTDWVQVHPGRGRSFV